MANSRRIYITLNSDKEKDRIIEELLSNSYSEADFIKETLYRLATQGNNVQLMTPINTEKVQKVNNSSKKVKKDAKPKSNKKEQRGTKSIIEDKKDISDINTEKVQKDEVVIKEGQSNTNNDNKELLNNLSRNLDNYF